VDENGDEVGPLPYPSLFDFDNLEPSRTSPRMFIREFTETGEPCAPSIWEENGAGNLGARTGLSSYDWLIVSAVGNLDGQEINEPEEGDSSCTIFYQVIEHYQGAFSDSPLISLFKGK
ncbi:MAG: hypothetical protein KDK51_07470, partial [Deltaproteobacteria bacterium]|nr:hypothetical protein [Deltaproteobacteria bacterium]